MNIQKIENIKLNVSKRRFKIDNCVKFSIIINIANVDKRVDRLIRIKKIISLSFYFITNVFIQIRDNFYLSINKNYIFYSKFFFDFKSKENVYSYIININIFIIQFRNIIDKTYIVSYYVKLNRVLDYEKKNYYITTSKNAYLTIKFKKQLFRNSFKLVLTRFINIFMFVFELILNLIIASYNVVVELSQINQIFNIAKFFTIITKSIINKISSISKNYYNIRNYHLR